MRNLLSILGPVTIIYTVYSVVLLKGLRAHLTYAASTFSRLIHVGSEFTDLSCARGFLLALHPFIHCTVLSLF